jgi:hypothetical protein
MSLFISKAPGFGGARLKLMNFELVKGREGCRQN